MKRFTHIIAATLITITAMPAANHYSVISSSDAYAVHTQTLVTQSASKDDPSPEVDWDAGKKKYAKALIITPLGDWVQPYL
ncbi:MAG: hypothetical protein VCC01_03870 [Candidatus Hydrogenedentota bacterium]